jgi:cell wall-associated NlpC family hydrolase
MSETRSEMEMRQAVVAEALSWVGTPYVSNAMVKGAVGGGTDCVMLLVAVYGNLGLLPKDLDPRPYPPQWHIHRNEELYMENIMKYAKEVPGPPARKPLPGDLVMFKIGKVFAHGSIIIDWPNVVHAIGAAVVMKEDVSKNIIGKRALALVPQRFFTLWD